MEIASELIASGSASYRQDFFRLHKERENCAAIDMGDVFSLLKDHGELIVHGLSNHADLKIALEWYDGFEAKYPAFCLPASMRSMQGLKMTAYRSLRDSIKAEHARAERNRWDGYCRKNNVINDLGSSSFLEIIRCDDILIFAR
jgi:hypothetical protein